MSLHGKTRKPRVVEGLVLEASGQPYTYDHPDDLAEIFDADMVEALARCYRMGTVSLANELVGHDDPDDP